MSNIKLCNLSALEQAKWIRSDINPSNPEECGCTPLFKKTFMLKSGVKTATALMAGLGNYKLLVNSKPASEYVYSQMPSIFDKTVFIDKYDLTSLLNENGENIITIELGNGFYNQFATDTWLFNTAPWIDYLKLIFHLEIDYGEQKEIIVSDEEWDFTNGATYFNELRSGEYCNGNDLNKLAIGKDINWKKAIIAIPPKAKYCLNTSKGIVVSKRIKPVSFWKSEKGYIFDFGINMSGWEKLTVTEDKDTEITMVYSEILNESNKNVLDRAFIESFAKFAPFQTNKYICSGLGEEIWEPSFTYHGFRYIEICGLKSEPNENTLEAAYVHSDLRENAKLSTSSDLINSLWTLTKNSTLPNFIYFPTDCPHREKNGWTGDAALSCEHMHINYNTNKSFDMWLTSIGDSQRDSGELPGIVPTNNWGYSCGPAWDMALFVLPHTNYRYTNNKEIVVNNLSAYNKYLAFLESMTLENGTVTFGLGDWCSPNMEPDRPKCPNVVSSTIISYYITNLCMELALIADDKALYEKAKCMNENFKKAFYKECFDAKTGNVIGDCQTSQALAIYYNILDDVHNELAVKKLVYYINEMDNHIDCGILGSKAILYALSDNGLTDLAWEIVSVETFPSWGNIVANNATTLWEMWDGTNSQNHHFFGEVSAWFFKSLLGINIDRDKNGVANIAFTPCFNKKVNDIEGSFNIEEGEAKVSWKFIDEDKIKLTATFPKNVSVVLNQVAGYNMIINNIINNEIELEFEKI